MNKQVSFTRFDECSKADVELIMRSHESFSRDLPKRVLAHLRLLDGNFGGFKIDRLQHSLQTASRAHRDGTISDGSTGDESTRIQRNKFLLKSIR